MKGIRLCGDCGYYDWNRHRCRRGAKVETDPRAKFYDDCPLPDAVEIKTGEWEEIADLEGCIFWRCTACGNEWCLNDGTPTENECYYCPRCGARMTGERSTHAE